MSDSHSVGTNAACANSGCVDFFEEATDVPCEA